MTDKERKRRQRERDRELGVKDLRLSMTAVERQLIHLAACAAGYDDQAEYVLDLVRRDCDTSRNNNEPCPDCRGRGCFTCCDSEAEIRMQDRLGETL